MIDNIDNNSQLEYDNNIMITIIIKEAKMLISIILSLLIFGYTGYSLYNIIKKASKGKCNSCDCCNNKKDCNIQNSNNK